MKNKKWQMKNEKGDLLLPISFFIPCFYLHFHGLLNLSPSA
jgi:hypothetical protein